MKGVTIFVCAAVTCCLGYNIDSCDNNKQLQVDESRQIVLTCNGITDDMVMWTVDHAGGGGTQIGTCTLSNGNCSFNNTYYTVTRDHNSTSRLTVKHDLRNRIAGKVNCSGWANGNVMNSSSCDVRVALEQSVSYNMIGIRCSTSVNVLVSQV
ncbi:hypothetical protein ACOMHN_058916 [Nucella lapillus]